ncbi:MAG: hypothetical protein GY847_40620 [Proteobacteria bacterium]|nr:hypothetical protein [Pseudomonadota bacterium]
MSFPQDNRLGAILNKICSLHKILKIILVLIISSYVYYSFDLHEKTSYLLNGSTEYAGEEERYEEFFFHQNYLFTALFCLTTASLFVLKTSFQRIVTMVGGALFIMHIVSSEDLQIIRGVLYFMPIFYLVSLMSFNQVKYCSTKVFFLVISMLFVYTIKSSYTEELLEYPHIPKEIHYIEYQKLYSTVKKTCNNDEIIIEASPSAFISGFYNVDIDYLLVSTKHIESNNYYFDDSTSTYKTVYQNVPILEEFSDIMKMDRDVCLIARSPTLRRFISRRKYYHLKKKFKYKSYKNLDLFYIPTNR